MLGVEGYGEMVGVDSRVVEDYLGFLVLVYGVRIFFL